LIPVIITVLEPDIVSTKEPPTVILCPNLIVSVKEPSIVSVLLVLIKSITLF
jgi:hypothetical protein